MTTQHDPQRPENGRLEWVKPPQQARSQQTLERILDAAELVFSEQGDQATVAEIVKQAQSSVGVFYARFDDKDALLRCLHDRFCERARETTRLALDPERWEGKGIADILATTIPFLVRIFHQRAGLIRCFIIRCNSDEHFAVNARQLHEYMSERLRDLLLARRREMSHPQPELAIDFGLSLMLDKLGFVTFTGDAECRTLQWAEEALAGELTRAFVGYLGVSPSAGKRSTPRVPRSPRTTQKVESREGTLP